MNQTFQTTPDGRVIVDGHSFPPFDLVRLLKTVFPIGERESIGVFTDLPDPRAVVGFAYLDQPGLGPQKHAYNTVYRGIDEHRAQLNVTDLAFYAYEEVGGSNLDLPDTVVTPDGEELGLRDTLKRHTIVIYMGRYSATAPITALAKELGLRGATMHGTNEIILASGLAVDYNEVSARAERLRKAMTKADAMLLEWHCDGEDLQLEVALGGQEAQKSHGLVHTTGDIANLPAGEVYYIPQGAEGKMPMQFEDAVDTIAIFNVTKRGIADVHRFVRGNRQTVQDFLDVVAYDPNAGQITELGLGTQTLPWAGADIQDEKILGTAHLATGRSDHLGGDISSANFKDKKNAAHNDVLYTPVKTPDVELRRVTMKRGGAEQVILEDYRPSAFVQELL